MTVTNALAYYGTGLISAVKRVAQGPGIGATKIFCFVTIAKIISGPKSSFLA